METKKGEKMDRRVRKTRAQLRAGLARLMQQKNIKEITVKDWWMRLISTVPLFICITQTFTRCFRA